MKKVLHFFSHPLHIFLGAVLIVLIWFIQIVRPTSDFLLQPSNLGTLTADIVTVIFFGGFLSSGIYILIGTVVFALGDTKKAPGQKAYAKKMLSSGFIVLILCLIGFFILQFYLQFFGLQLQPLGCGPIKDC